MTAILSAISSTASTFIGLTADCASAIASDTSGVLMFFLVVPFASAGITILKRLTKV